MNPMFGNRLVRAVVMVGFITSLSGCYYTQAARGQLDVMSKRESIDDVINASDTSPELSERLRLVQEARQYSIDDLHLPDNGSYRTYADIERNFVVWNVFAAPEFSLEAKRWCFPVAGCVNYRGYFSENAAQRKASQLEQDGHDVAVGGVAAYSTLGKFSDPVLNTMLQWEDSDLIAVIFHELAHQLLYVKDDSSFNESFATAVEEFGLERWLLSRDERAELAKHRQRREFRGRVMAHVDRARIELGSIYSGSISVDAMRTQKKNRLAALHDDLAGEFERSGREPPAWLSNGLNNARLASMVMYEGRLPEFRALFAECDEDFVCFYDRAKESANRERDVSHRK
jgi:predicted aminopeptidase